MDGFGITWFDLAALAIVAFSGIMAFARGLIRELFSIVAFIGAGIAAYYLADRGRGIVESITSLDGSLAILGSGLIIFLAVFFGIMLITSVVAKQAHQSTDIGSFDRAAGLAFGVLRGILVVSLFVVLLRQTTDSAEVAPQATMPSAIANARTYPIYEGVAVALERFLPQARERASGIIDRRRQSDSQPAPATPATDL
ncbi:MAG: CvpA family protein [Caulobacterales bacterium]